MGKTYTNKFEYDEFTIKRSGKHSKHNANRKSVGMRTLNSYVEEDYNLDDDTEFEDKILYNIHKTDTN